MNPPLSTTIRVPLDGLSRCLCPLLDSTILSSHRRIRRPILSARRPHINIQATAASRLCQRRGYNGQTAAYKAATKNTASFTPNEDPELTDLPIEQLHDRLRWSPHEAEDAYKKTTSLVHYLITERGEKPSLIHYNALISINADAQLGSAAVVEELLAEMKEQQINADSGLYHNVLQVLAIHPNYLLRIQVLDEMKERWISLTPSGYNSVLLGLLRDHQFERALSMYQNALQNAISFPSYVQDTMVYTLLNSAELDTALALLQSRVANQGASDVSNYVWYYILSTFASAFHYPGIKYVWQKRVEESYINPSDGICTAALNTAARNRDPVLATDVIRILANRKARIEVYHYEALLQAYIGVGDVRSAIRMLCIMRKANLQPDGASTRELVLWLQKRRNDEHLNSAWGILKELNANGQAIPTAAANAILEALSFRGKLQEAIDTYKVLHEICVDGADTETFNVLLKGCRDSTIDTKTKKALAMFLASEMHALGVEASELTYDRLILVCLIKDEPHETAEKEEEEHYEVAFRYYEEMKRVGGARGWKPRPGTYLSMVKACGEKEPERAWALIDEMGEWRMSSNLARKWMEQIGFPRPEPVVQEISSYPFY